MIQRCLEPFELSVQTYMELRDILLGRDAYVALTLQFSLESEKQKNVNTTDTGDRNPNGLRFTNWLEESFARNSNSFRRTRAKTFSIRAKRRDDVRNFEKVLQSVRPCSWSFSSFFRRPRHRFRCVHFENLQLC